MGSAHLGACARHHRSPFGLTERTPGRREEATVPTLSMPDRPHLDRFRRQARALQRAVRAGDPQAVARLRRHHPGGRQDTLTAAQLVIAREYGFASWPRLTRY